MISGEERRFLEITSHLRALGSEIFTIEYEPSLSESWGYSGYRSIPLNLKFKNHYFLEATRLSVHGLRACIKLKCDVIYSPGGWDHISLNPIDAMPPYAVSLLCRKPLVVVFHHIHNRSRFLDMGTLTRTLIILALKQAKACIMVSRATKEDVEKNFRINRATITGNGVNLQIFKKVKDQAKIYDAIYFGRVSKEKGIATLLKAWKAVVEKSPLAKLILVGGIDNNSQEIFTNLIQELGLNGKVSFAGFVSDQEAANLLNSSRIFVLPSTEEGFGLTVLEAMATGLPCVVSDLPAFKENFKSAAVLVKLNNAKDLAEAILILLSDPEMCKKLEKKGKQLAEHFSWDKVAQKELEVFESVIKH
jgi:glycosyltransferase involved in cell wall biosynthesis